MLFRFANLASCTFSKHYPQYIRNFKVLMADTVAKFFGNKCAFWLVFIDAGFQYGRAGWRGALSGYSAVGTRYTRQNFLGRWSRYREPAMGTVDVSTANLNSITYHPLDTEPFKTYGSADDIDD